LEVSEHVEFRAASVGARASDTAAALEKVGFPQQLWSVPIGSLSAGQRRKVAIASLLVGRPQLWLLDEPHAALDAESRKNLDAILIEASASGATIIFVSHESPVTKEIGSRVVTMDGGRITEDSGAG
jgi:energy-coupling factor transporter ATP-binding protein EcfA2